MQAFRDGPVFFAGDSAHGVSPFGARGANSGVQDADNLGWKLAAVLQGRAPAALLDTYGWERERAADENLLHSTRATDFITPKSEVSRLFRDAVLQLARTQPFARTLVNSGRLSVPSVLHGSPLNTPDEDEFSALQQPGAAAVDAPMNGAWLLRRIGPGFTLAFDGDVPGWAQDLDLDILRFDGEAARARYDLRPGTAYLFRPDQHVAARWRVPTAAKVRAALAKACAC
jgi:3-(3-hydroxy-phenyl)propionate hydroxylase